MFEPGRIALQMIRLCQPTFSAALIGHIEATVTNDADKQALTSAVPMPDTAADWARAMVTSLTNERLWNRNPTVRPWLADCRLNISAAWAHIPTDDTDARAHLTRLTANMMPAIDNLQRLTTEKPARPSTAPAPSTAL